MGNLYRAAWRLPREHIGEPTEMPFPLDGGIRSFLEDMMAAKSLIVGRAYGSSREFPSSQMRVLNKLAKDVLPGIGGDQG